jgi:hypothetical protein
MLYHLTTSMNPALLWGAFAATALFIAITSVKEKKDDPKRA